VTAAPPPTFTFAPTDLGQTVTLAASVKPADAGQKVTWYSGNKAIAKVNGSGLVTAVSEGTVRIYAEATDGSGVRGDRLRIYHDVKSNYSAYHCRRYAKGDLCRLANVSSSTVSKLAKGKSVNTEVLFKICNALKCDTSDIMEIVTGGSTTETNE
jgi:DNA-binding Xre family transcriptional regulator